MKIYDCFQFFDENMMLDLRLNMLNDYVHKFVIVENAFMHSGKKKNIVTELNPENRYYPVTNNTTTEASIHVNLIRDLYIVLGDGDRNEGWIVRIYYNPLVIWIWIGALTIFVGGLISIRNNLKFVKRINV